MGRTQPHFPPSAPPPVGRHPRKFRALIKAAHEETPINGNIVENQKSRAHPSSTTSAQSNHKPLACTPCFRPVPLVLRPDGSPSPLVLHLRWFSTPTGSPLPSTGSTWRQRERRQHSPCQRTRTGRRRREWPPEPLPPCGVAVLRCCVAAALRCRHQVRGAPPRPHGLCRNSRPTPCRDPNVSLFGPVDSIDV